MRCKMHMNPPSQTAVKKLYMFPPSQTASGVRQKDIAEKVGLSKVRVSEIVSGSKSSETEHVPAVTNG